MVLYPDVDTPFENEFDVVNRLLPYHVYQHPKEDLDRIRHGKGKERATAEDVLREEIEGVFVRCLYISSLDRFCRNQICR